MVAQLWWQTASAGDGLEEKLKNFDVPPSLGEVFAPRVEPVAREQEAMKGLPRGVAPVGSRESIADSLREFVHVLAVSEYGHFLKGFVRADALKALEHFVAFDPQTASRQVAVGENRAPDGMRVQDRANRWNEFGNHAVQERLGRGFLGRPTADPSGSIHPHEVVAAEGRLVLAAGSNEQFERVSRRDHAVVAASAQRPRSRMKLLSDAAKLLDRIGNGWVDGWCACHACCAGRNERAVGASQSILEPLNASPQL